MQALRKNDISLKETLKKDHAKKIDAKNFSESIEQYFGMMEGKLGTMEDIDSYIQECRSERNAI